jgi:hypothetical protein
LLTPKKSARLFPYGSFLTIRISTYVTNFVQFREFENTLFPILTFHPFAQSFGPADQQMTQIRQTKVCQDVLNPKSQFFLSLSLSPSFPPFQSIRADKSLIKQFLNVPLIGTEKFSMETSHFTGATLYVFRKTPA